MSATPTKCPFCGGEIAVTRIYCRECDTTIDGHFSIGPFAQLKPEQLTFIELFVRNEGRIKRLEEELSLSYPTIRKQLHDVIRAMGYEPGGEELDEEAGGMSEEQRQKILADLDQGLISYEDAMRLLKESEE
jgi:hypothetical protein